MTTWKCSTCQQQECVVRQRFQDKCFKCGAEDNLQLDHHRPLNDGHELSLGNAVLLCKVCNGRKTCLPPERFYSAEELDMLERKLEP